MNVRTHRWSIKPEIGVSRAWRRLTISHLIYHFRRSVWGALDATYYTGGETTIDGVESDDRQRTTRVGRRWRSP